MELIIIIALIIAAAYLGFRHFAKKTELVTITVADVVAKAEVVETKPEAKKPVVKKATTRTPKATEKKATAKKKTPAKK